ncbi:MAG: N-6 DNA methylase [Bacteroidia bacterium]
MRTLSWRSRVFPLFLIETKATPQKREEGFRQARAYAILQNPERPIPYLWVAAGLRDWYYGLSKAPDCLSIRYQPILKLPEREELVAAFSVPSQLTLSEAAEEIRHIQALLLEGYQLISSGNPKKDWLKFAHWWESFLLNRPYPKDIKSPICRKLERLYSSFEGGVKWAYPFRHLYRKLFQGKGLGQFLTPIEVIEFLAAWADPRPGQRILDPAMGSGGFIEVVAAYLQARYGVRSPALEGALVGWEKEESFLPLARVFCQMLLYKGDGHTFEGKNLQAADAFEEFDSNAPLFDCILTNPPAEELPAEKVEELEKKGFELFGRGRDKSPLTAVAFLEMALRLLKEGGRLGIIVPVGFLSGSDHRMARYRLFSERLTPHALIELPRGFFPKAASAMAILLGEKGKPPPGHKAILIATGARDLGAQLKLLKMLATYAG